MTAVYFSEPEGGPDAKRGHERRRSIRHGPRRRAGDGERHFWRCGSADGLCRLAERRPHSLFPRARARASDGALVVYRLTSECCEGPGLNMGWNATTEIVPTATARSPRDRANAPDRV